MRKTCLEEIYQLAKKDSRVVFIGSDIASGTLERFKSEMPDRFFMEGISESHLVGMMAGLAMNGKIPYFNTIAPFITRRAFEQIFLDAGLHRLNIRLIGSGGGLVYAPLGPTHLALEDIGALRLIPGMTILVPCDAEEMKRLMPQTLDYKGPIYIRLAKGGDPIVSRVDKPCQIGKIIVLEDGKDVLLVSTGITTKIALEAKEKLFKNGISAGVLHCHTLKPFDSATLLEKLEFVKGVVTIEEHNIIGGLGSAVSEVMAEAGYGGDKKLIRIGIPDVFPHRYGSQDFLLEYYGITSENIVKHILQMRGL